MQYVLLHRMVLLLAPRESAWAVAQGVSCNDVCDSTNMTTSYAPVHKITSVSRYLRANRAMNLRSRDRTKSKLIDDSTPGKCDSYERALSTTLNAPKAQQKSNPAALHCTYNGEFSNAGHAFGQPGEKKWQLCCCTDPSTIPPEDESTACPVVTDDCDQEIYMALIATEGAAKEGICMRFTSETCPHGHYADTSSNKCVACEPGKYARRDGGTSESACISCPAGSYGTEEAQTSEASGCTECMSGKTSLAGATQCVTPLGGVGWVLGPPLWNCDRVCAAGGGGTCRAERQQAVITQAGFITIMTAVRAERGDGSDVNFDGVCSTYTDSAGMNTPESPSRGFNDQKCRVDGSTGPSTCGKSDVKIVQERMCCCVDAKLISGTDDDDVKTMCPVSVSDCKLGTWFSTALGRCIPCESGKWGLMAGRFVEYAGCSGVSACPVGKYGLRGVTVDDRTAGNDLCPVYPRTLTSAGVMQTHTEVCAVPPPGRYAPSEGLDLDTLSLCPRGRLGINASEPGFSVSTNYEAEANACPRQCPKGTWAPSAGLASVDQCVTCLPGTFSLAGGLISEDQCTGSCGPGMFSPLGEQGCKNCSAGKWSTRDRIASDEQCGSVIPDETGRCPAGRFGRESGLTSAGSCTLCSAGRFSDDEGLSSDCVGVCPAGRHGDLQLGLTSADQCVDCIAGRFSGATAITSPDQCSGSCEQGKYSATPGASSSSPCVDCEADFVAPTGKSACVACATVRSF